MEHRVKYLLVGILLAASSMAFAGQKAAPATAGSTAFDRMVDRVIAREAENNKSTADPFAAGGDLPPEHESRA